MGLLHWLLDVVLGKALLVWTQVCGALSFYLLLSIGWSHKIHPPPTRLKVLAWWTGLAVAASALLATPPLVLWFGIAHGFWFTVTVQAALLAVPLALLARAAWRRRPWRSPEPEVRRPRPPQPGPDVPEPPPPAS
ncbi:hypothetical protein [Streptomyces phytophilus]|uniref:hypothetical protein n=1 Tax=Streptomyces phytophilus TaxID=722715 RepID=UPI0015F0CA8F|nr:hypothetical protein [Streptomyces phytophilus]